MLITSSNPALRAHHISPAMIKLSNLEPSMRRSSKLTGQRQELVVLQNIEESCGAWEDTMRASKLGHVRPDVQVSHHTASECILSQPARMRWCSWEGSEHVTLA